MKSILFAAGLAMAAAVEMSFHRVAVNKWSYGDPTTGCKSTEMNVTITGVTGDFCSPPCDSSNNCPTDYPTGCTATGECVLEVNGATTPTYCALICDPTKKGDCGKGDKVACQAIQGVGLCTYSD